MFIPPIRYRHKLTRDEHITAVKAAAGQYLLGCLAIGINLLISFSDERLRVYYLPIILMFVVSSLIAFALRFFWQQNTSRDEAASHLLMYLCIILSCIYWRDFDFNSRPLGTVHVTNVFQSYFSVIHIIAFLVAAFLIPCGDWLAFRVAAFLAGTCLLGAGMPQKEIAAHERYVTYLATIAYISVFLINLDIARSFRAWSASSPHATLERSERILSKFSLLCGYLTPIRFLLAVPRMWLLTWRAQVLWLSGWPVPPESLDPKLAELGHYPVFRSASVRYLAAALAQGSLLASILVYLPPVTQSPWPYRAIAFELVFPPFMQFTSLWIAHGWFFFTIDELSQPKKGTP